MKNYAWTWLIFFVLILTACNSSTIKENINKTGNAAGQAIGELATGISNGVKSSIMPIIEFDDHLKQQGVAFGKMSINNDSAGNANILVAYVIFEKDFNGVITAKAYDARNLEMGRVKLEVKGKKEEARFVEFHFDKRTEIANDSKIKLE